MAPLGDPRVEDFLVGQALDCANRQLKKLGGFAGAAASGGGVRGHACLHLKTSIYRQLSSFRLANTYIDFQLLHLMHSSRIVSLGTLGMFHLFISD